MDQRFPKIIRYIVGKLNFLGIPNLGMLIAGLGVLAFVGQNILGAPLYRFMFDPYMLAQGEWWRAFAFPVQGIENPIYLFFFVIYIYFIMNALEQSWGVGPLTIFTLFSYSMALLGAMLTMRSISIWYYVVENISLAFGTLFPEIEFYLFFVIPVKSKWLAAFAGALILVDFIVGDLNKKLFILTVMTPYLTFFGPMVFRSGLNLWRQRKR